MNFRLACKWRFAAKALTAIALLASCKREDPKKEPAPFPPDMNRGVLILCEGNFNRGSGDVWFYDTASHRGYPSLYRSQNGSDLGNVVQSYYQIGNAGFLVVNNSGKITVVDRLTFKQTSTITGFQSPRYIIPTQAPFAYVTDLYSGTITIINTTDMTRSPRPIRLGAWTEQGVASGGKAYIISRRIMLDARSGGEALYTINTITNVVEDSVSLGKGGEEVVLDGQNRLWLSVDSIAGNGGKPVLICYEPSSKTIVHTITLAGLKPIRLSLSPDNQYMFFIHEGISLLKLDNPQTIRKAVNRRSNWTSLKVISGKNGQYRLIAADSKDYISNSVGYDIRFTEATTIVTDSFPLGMISGNIY